MAGPTSQSVRFGTNFHRPLIPPREEHLTRSDSPKRPARPRRCILPPIRNAKANVFGHRGRHESNVKFGSHRSGRDVSPKREKASSAGGPGVGGVALALEGYLSESTRSLRAREREELCDGIVASQTRGARGTQRRIPLGLSQLLERRRCSKAPGDFVHITLKPPFGPF